MSKITTLKIFAAVLTGIVLCLALASCGGTTVTLHNGDTVTSASVSGEFQLEVPTNPGYEFQGWYSAAEGGTAYTDKDGKGLSEWSSDNPGDLYAQWQLKEYTFNLDVRGGETSAPTSFNMLYLSIFDSNLPVPTKTGFAFDGWYNANDVKVSSENGELIGDFSQFNVTGFPTNEENNTVSLYAKWVEKKINFTFVTDGGTEVKPIGAGLGEKISFPVTAKEGYCFIGWSRSGGAEDFIPMHYTVKNTDSENTALYAVYRPATVAGVTFTLINNDTEYSVAYVGSESEVYIPDIYQGRNVTKVTAISKSVKVLYLPNTATTINEGAMSGCTALTTLRLPSSLTRITKNMLKGCAALTDIVIPASVTAIDEGALYGTAFKTVEIPAGVRNIGTNALFSVAVSEINVHPNNQYYASVNGVLYEKTGSELKLQQYPRLKAGEEFTPAEGCTAIMDYAFMYAGYDNNGVLIENALKKITISGKIKAVGNSAYESSSVVVVVVDTTTGSSLSFGTRAFYNCRELRMIRFLNSATPSSFGQNFINTTVSSTYIYVPTASKTMYAQKLSGYSSRIRTENDIYGNYAVEAYQGGYRILQYLGYESEVVVPAYINGLEVKAIGAHAFSGCTTVTKVTVEATTLMSIESAAFSGCVNMVSFTIYAENPPSLAYDAFGSHNSEFRIYVPSGNSINAYRQASGWSAFSEIIFTVGA